MTMNLLSILDLSSEEVLGLIESAISLKRRLKQGITHQPLRGKTLALIFEKPSTRTRVSFETAMYQMGGGVIFVSESSSQIGRGEPIKDTARVMGGYVDGVVMRTFGHEIIEEFSEYSSVPVINGLTDEHHPCQVLADLMTIYEVRGGLDGLKAAWVGDGNNMANSWIEAASILGFELRVASPDGYKPSAQIIEMAGKSGSGKVRVVDTAAEALKGAHVVSTDVWASMGQESERSERIKAFESFQINSEVLKGASDDCIVLHCLPAHRGEEITEEVLEGPMSYVWQEAENRLHIQKALLERLLAP